MQHILLVEDDPRLSDLVKSYLQQNQFRVSVINRGDKALKLIPELSPDLIILDIMLPGIDGISICKKIRPEFVGPILFLTAKDSDFDQVLGLEIGADDYVIKPVEPRVLLARVNNLLRRSFKSSEVESDELNFGLLSIIRHSRVVKLNQEPIEITSHEFDLLWLLANNAGSIISRENIYQELVGREYDGLDRSVDVRISRLRKKLFDNSESPFRIKTIWGKGYLFVADAWAY
jgi:two-component system, OmpR family, response regulator